jgi:hypothetical protein
LQATGLPKGWLVVFDKKLADNPLLAQGPAIFETIEADKVLWVYLVGIAVLGNTTANVGGNGLISKSEGARKINYRLRPLLCYATNTWICSIHHRCLVNAFH